jgi:predicted ATPase
MAKLEYITIKGFKSIASVERLQIRPINILIGANGSGKSNFIEAFSFLREFSEGRLKKYVARAGGANKVLHFGAKRTSVINIGLVFEDSTGYDIRLTADNSDGLVDNESKATAGTEFLDQVFRKSISTGRLPDSSMGDGELLEKIAGYVRAEYDKVRVYHFHDTSESSPMTLRANINDNRSLREDAGNLASFLYFLRLKHPTSYKSIRSVVRSAAPFFDDFDLEPNNLNTETITLQWHHKDSDQFFGAADLSDGTLRFMALATLFLQPMELQPSVILVDEPEIGLHPFAIGLLASLIKQAAVSTQVIVSTQSALLLDYFEPEDVLVAERVDGGTVINRLDSEKLQVWLEDYSLGQLWEKNELGGRPGAL